MKTLSLVEAVKIVDAALRKARELHCAPMTVTVLDAGGHTVALQREDGSSLLRPEIAHAKAWGPLGMGSGGRSLEKRAKASPEFWASLDVISHGRIAPVPGGVLIRDQEGVLLGAAGASGDLPETDEACVLAGIAAAALVADPG